MKRILKSNNKYITGVNTANMQPKAVQITKDTPYTIIEISMVIETLMHLLLPTQQLLYDFSPKIQQK